MHFRSYVTYNYKEIFSSLDFEEAREEFETYKQCMVDGEIVQLLDMNLKVVDMCHTFDTEGGNKHAVQTIWS